MLTQAQASVQDRREAVTLTARHGQGDDMKALWIGVSAACLAFGVATADTVYTTRSAFTAAAGALTTITFDGIAPAGGFVSYGGGPLTLSGVTFTSNATMFVIDSGYYGSAYPNGGYLNADYAGTDVITAVLPGSTAVGFDVGGLFGGQTFTIDTSDGGSFTYTTPNSITGTASLGFFGVTSATPITSVSIAYTDGSYGAIDNFSYGGAVPEPTSWVLMVLGFGGVGAIGRRRQALATFG
jgi:hypothetical protein